jgi:hypothetical protein
MRSLVKIMRYNCFATFSVYQTHYRKHGQEALLRYDALWVVNYLCENCFVPEQEGYRSFTNAPTVRVNYDTMRYRIVFSLV